MRGSHQPLSVSASQLELKQLQRLPNKLLLVMFPWRGTTAENLTEGVYMSICHGCQGRIFQRFGDFNHVQCMQVQCICVCMFPLVLTSI